jgi:hypothetical protein
MSFLIFGNWFSRRASKTEDVQSNQFLQPNANIDTIDNNEKKSNEQTHSNSDEVHDQKTGETFSQQSDSQSDKQSDTQSGKRTCGKRRHSASRKRKSKAKQWTHVKKHKPSIEKITVIRQRNYDKQKNEWSYLISTTYKTDEFWIEESKIEKNEHNIMRLNGFKKFIDTPDENIQVSYLVHEPINGKSMGWYKYDHVSNKEVVKYYKQYLNAIDGGWNTHFIHMGHYNYMINFKKLYQENIEPHLKNTKRSIRFEIMP